jgi:hypothetical protein
MTTMTADWLNHPCIQSGLAEVLLCSYEDEGHQQPLHAKAMIFESGQTRTLVYGSANFTSLALLTHGKRPTSKRWSSCLTFWRNRWTRDGFVIRLDPPITCGHRINCNQPPAMMGSIRRQCQSG